MRTTAAASAARRDDLITKLFDAITGYNCLSREDIMVNGGFDTLPEVDEALMTIRQPDVAEEYGWTVPHARRGRPRDGEQYRYLVVGLNGEVLSDEDVNLVQEGTQSTVRAIAAQTRNQANALRLTRPAVFDKSYRKWALDTSKILDGISVQAQLEADRLGVILAAVSAPPTP